MFVKVYSGRQGIIDSGKKRPGFDITLKLKWCATCDESSEEAKGTITINDVFFLFLGRVDG